MASTMLSPALGVLQHVHKQTKQPPLGPLPKKYFHLGLPPSFSALMIDTSSTELL